MAIAQAEGRHPVEAARDYDIISGKPAKKAEAMLRDFILAGGKVQWHSLTDQLADATFTHPQTGEVRIDWDMRQGRGRGEQEGHVHGQVPAPDAAQPRGVGRRAHDLAARYVGHVHEPGEQADIPVKDEHTGKTIEADEPDTRDALNDEVPLASVAAATPRGPVVRGPVTEYTREQWQAWLKKTEAAMRLLRSRAEIEQAATRDSIKNAFGTGQQWLIDELDAILAEAYARFPNHAPLDISPPDDPDLEIVGEKYAAG